MNYPLSAFIAGSVLIIAYHVGQYFGFKRGLVKGQKIRAAQDYLRGYDMGCADRLAQFWRDGCKVRDAKGRFTSVRRAKQ